jgi:hypothetical protein
VADQSFTLLIIIVHSLQPSGGFISVPRFSDDLRGLHVNVIVFNCIDYILHVPDASDTEHGKIYHNVFAHERDVYEHAHRTRHGAGRTGADANKDIVLSCKLGKAYINQVAARDNWRQPI